MPVFIDVYRKGRLKCIYICVYPCMFCCCNMLADILNIISSGVFMLRWRKNRSYFYRFLCPFGPNTCIEQCLYNVTHGNRCKTVTWNLKKKTLFYWEWEKRKKCKRKWEKKENTQSEGIKQDTVREQSIKRAHLPIFPSFSSLSRSIYYQYHWNLVRSVLYIFFCVFFSSFILNIFFPLILRALNPWQHTYRNDYLLLIRFYFFFLFSFHS